MPLSTRRPLTRSAARPEACAARSCSSPLRRSSGLPIRCASSSSGGVPSSTSRPSGTEMRSSSTALTSDTDEGGEPERQRAVDLADPPGVLGGDVRQRAGEPVGVGTAAGIDDPAGEVEPQVVGGAFGGLPGGARTVPVAVGQHGERHGQRRDPADQRPDLTGGDRVVDHQADQHGHQRLAGLVPAGQHRAQRDRGRHWPVTARRSTPPPDGSSVRAATTASVCRSAAGGGRGRRFDAIAGLSGHVRRLG